MPPDVSVVIAAYKVENYIERAIKSALDQEGVAVEVIAVNDASPDNTLAVISGINDPRVKCVNQSVNGGPSRARNAGIEAAAAPWIAILDGDDALLPGRLARCLLRAKMVNADIVVDNLVIRREADGGEYPMFPPASFARLGMLDLAKFIGGNTSLLGGISFGYTKPIFSTAFLREHDLVYDPEIRITEDYILMCEALASGARCVAEPSAGYLYTVRKGSISYRLTPADVEHFIISEKKFCTRYALDPAATKAHKRREYALKEALSFTRLVGAIKQRDVKAAIKAATTCPSAVRHLWRPVWARIERMFRQCRTFLKARDE